MEIIRGRLAAKDFSNPALRYNDGTDTVQFTPDDGTTWVDAPSADPRHSIIYQKPPLTTTDPRCDAAANMVKWIKDFIDSVIASLNAGATELAITNDFLTRLSAMFPPALLLLLLQEAATSLFDTGATALDAAFTSTQYDLLLCAFDCNIESDGTVTPSDLTDIEVQIASTMDSVPAAIVDEILFIQGEIGLTNAGIIGGETGDCTDCNCAWCYNTHDGARLDEWISHDWGTNPPATYSSGQWNGYPGLTNTIWVSWDLADTVEFTDAALTETDFENLNRDIWVNGDGTAFTGTQIWHNGAVVGSPFPINVDRIDIIMVQAFNGAPRILRAAQFSGTGDNPFGADNC